MKISVKKIDALKRQMTFEIPKERVSQKLDEVYKELQKVAKVKGFRPGKAPRDVIESQHGTIAREETIKKLIPEAYQEGIEKESLEPLDIPEISDVHFKDGIIKFTAHFDIKPGIKIKNYKGIKVTRKSSKVTEEEVNKTLEYFTKGQEADKTVPLNDEFAKGLGYPSLEAFKESLSRQMEIDKDRQNRFDVENQIVGTLLKEVKMTVPQSLVNKQLEYRLEESKGRLKSQGLPDEEIKKKEEGLRKELKDHVEKDVKVYLIFDKIAALENIQLKKDDNMPRKVMEFLFKEAVWQEEDKSRKS